MVFWDWVFVIGVISLVIILFFFVEDEYRFYRCIIMVGCINLRLLLKSFCFLGF